MKMVEQMSDVDVVINGLIEIQADVTVPRNIRTKIESIISTLKGGTEMSIKVNKALNEFEEIASDANMHAYTRTQLWNIISMLEKLLI